MEAGLSECMDAFQPVHLPLPRAIGGYAVVRTTKEIRLGALEDRMVLLGPMKHYSAAVLPTATNGFNWTNLCAVASPNVAGATALGMNAANNCTRYSFDSMDINSFGSSSLVPAAFSVQIMNGSALQTTNGILYAGRSKQILRLANDTRSWETLQTQLLSYTAPRLLAAGKMALRGVQVDAIPCDMNELSGFTQLEYYANDATFTWTADFIEHAGFAPIWLFVPKSTPMNLLITCEWRCRFDPSNPAHSTHTTRKPAAEGLWSRAITGMEAAGSGVRDISERLARSGVAQQALTEGMSLLRLSL